MKTSLGIWAFGPMVTRLMPGGLQPEHAGETTVERVRRAVEGLDEVRDALDGHGIYTICTGLHLDAREHGERLGFDLYPYTENAVAAVRRSVEHWRFIEPVAARIDDAALREAQSRKDAVAVYELVYAALGV